MSVTFESMIFRISHSGLNVFSVGRSDGKTMDHELEVWRVVYGWCG